MGTDAVLDGSPSIGNSSTGEIEAASNNIDSVEAVSSGGYSREFESIAKILTRFELELACSAEKLVNLTIFVMWVASRENDFESCAVDDESAPESSLEKALQCDHLCGFIGSEVREMESHLSALQTEIADSRGIIISFKHLGGSLMGMEEKLQDCEESLKRSFEQITDIKGQFENLQMTFPSSSGGDETWKREEDLSAQESRGTSDLNAKIRMETAEQQRHVLRMLEKSLAREIDLEIKLSESRQNEEDLNIRLQQEILSIVEEAEEVWERLFEADNKAEILSGILKELSGRIQTAEFSTNEAIKREEELSSKLQNLAEQLNERDSALLESGRCRTELQAKVNLLEHNLRELDRVEQLEKQLKDSEVKWQHAAALADASQEKQTMLDFTIKDMENLIKDLKLKVSKSESQTESAEDKCIILSETNAELLEEINFLRNKVKTLEASLHQTDEAKKKTAKGIKKQTQLIEDLIVQLALERERLHKQISSLIEEKKAASVKYMQHIRKEPSVTVTGSPDAKTASEPRDPLTNDTETTDSNSTSVRNIDAKQLTHQCIVMVILVLGIPATVAYFKLFQKVNWH